MANSGFDFCNFLENFFSENFHSSNGGTHGFMKSQLYVQESMFSLKSFQLIQQLIKSYISESLWKLLKE